MVIDFRMYTMKVGCVQPFLELFEKEGLAPQIRICGNFMGIYRQEIGNINQIIMMFGYTDAGERERRRAMLYKDAEFMAYLKKAREFIAEQDVRLLVPSACNPKIDGVNC